MYIYKLGYYYMLDLACINLPGAFGYINKYLCMCFACIVMYALDYVSNKSDGRCPWFMVNSQSNICLISLVFNEPEATRDQVPDELQKKKKHRALPSSLLLSLLHGLGDMQSFDKLYIKSMHAEEHLFSIYLFPNIIL